jgi:hypothetical protein
MGFPHFGTISGYIGLDQQEKAILAAAIFNNIRGGINYG